MYSCEDYGRALRFKPGAIASSYLFVDHLMIFSLLLSACLTLTVWGHPACATEDCEDTELLTVKSQTEGLERPRRAFHRVRDDDNVNYFVFPVQGDYAWNVINKKRHKVTVTARGGGTRAMAGVIGQLRALKDMNLSDEVDQYVAISGATWATSVYLFADKSYSSEDLLGATTFGKLADLTLGAISTPNGELIKSANEPHFIICWRFWSCHPQVLGHIFPESIVKGSSGKSFRHLHLETHIWITCTRILTCVTYTWILTLG